MRLLSLLCILLFAPLAMASSTSQETWSLGAFGGIVTSNEADLNTLITRANARSGAGPITTPQFGNSYEFGGYIQRRLNGSILAIQLRPSYFTNSTTGTGSNGQYSYSLTGFTFAPIFRLYILENGGIQLFIQGGISWGSLSGTIQEGPATVNFNGSEWGYLGGMGVNFCFGARNQHCITAQGNVRYLSVPRNIVSDHSGTFANGSVSQATNGLELEIDGHDLATTMSGIQGLLGYQYNL